LGRKEMNAVREKARLAYIDMVARISATACNGRTLRQALEFPGRGNPWWYTKFSFKDVESDPTFNVMLQVFTILNVAKRQNIKDIVLYGAPCEIREALSSRYRIRKSIKRYFIRLLALAKGAFSRMKLIFDTLSALFALKVFADLPKSRPDVLFQGFWDWSVCPGDDAESLNDIYFKSLPGQLKLKGFTHAWLLWLSPIHKPGAKKRSLKQILSRVKGHPQLIFLQKFLSLKDVLFAALDFRPLYRYLRFRRLSSFRDLFTEEGLDFFPFLNHLLICDFVSSTIPLFTLIESSSRRAFVEYGPKINFTFLEFYPHSRALYEGGRSARPEAIHCTIQHASYNREKTFLALDRERELYGKPDNRSVPVPDYMFAMGELGRDIFIEDGFSQERILLTGSPRHENIRISARQENRQDKEIYNVLLVATLNPRHDFEMVQAASAAAEGLKNIKLYIRSHPFARMEDLREYRPYRHKIISTKGTLDENLKMADLVIFTYSTVAEEALLQGAPIFQWLTAGYNASVFRDLEVEIPKFYSVLELRKGLENFASNPHQFHPTETTKSFIERQCFFKADGRSSERIAESLKKIEDERKY